MDRAERRRRHKFYDSKGRWCHHCSKKTPGRPKVPRGTCGLGMDRSPKIGRNRWRLDPDIWE